MSGTPSADELLGQWQQSAEQGMEAWLAMLGRGSQPEISQYWMPFFNQGMELLNQLKREGASPDLLQLWKRFLDEGIEGWSKALEQAMQSEAFASAFGKYLQQYLGTIGPVQKEMQKAREVYLKTLGLPSRTQIGEITSQISWVESRIEELEEKIDAVAAGLTSLHAIVERGRAGPQVGPPSSSEKRSKQGKTGRGKRPEE